LVTEYFDAILFEMADAVKFLSQNGKSPIEIAELLKMDIKIVNKLL
jgi:hypothetical protein